MDQEDYTKLLPPEPPEGMMQWLMLKGHLKEELIIYRAAYVADPLTDEREKVVEITCSDCGGKAHMPYVAGGCCGRYASAPFGYFNTESGENVMSGEVTRCPMCGAEVRAAHVGTIHGAYNTDALFPLSVHIIDGKLALLGWCIYKSIGKDGRTMFIKHPYEGYVFDGKKCTRLTGYTKYMCNISFIGGWRQLKRCQDIWGKTPCDSVFPWDSGILTGTAFENSHLDEYMKDAKEIYPVTYMRLWQRHKNIENLVVQGASALLSDMIRKNCMYSGYYGQSHIPTMKLLEIDWKEKRPSKMLGLTKEEYRAAVKQRWNAHGLDFYKNMKEYGIRTDDMELCRQFSYPSIYELAYAGHPVMKTLRYIIRQRQRCGSQNIDIRYIMDYWSMAVKNGADLSDNDIRYPQSVINAHDGEVRKIKYKEDKELSEKFKKRYEKLRRFCWSDGVLEIHPAVDEKEMIVEGKILHHCVGTYAKRHAGGGTAIFFIRHCAEPEQPYFTLELDEKDLTVRQTRGLRNCERTDEVTEFEEKWLKYIKKVEKENRKHGRSDNTAA